VICISIGSDVGLGILIFLVVDVFLAGFGVLVMVIE
jgi:hypothetical protein